MEITLTEKNFDEEVLKAEMPVLVDFWATWCAPCRMLAPTIAELAEERTDIKVGKVNVDEEPGLAGRYGINAIPTLIVFKNGKPEKSATGYMPRASVEALLPE